MVVLPAPARPRRPTTVQGHSFFVAGAGGVGDEGVGEDKGRSDEEDKGDASGLDRRHWHNRRR